MYYCEIRFDIQYSHILFILWKIDLNLLVDEGNSWSSGLVRGTESFTFSSLASNVAVQPVSWWANFINLKFHNSTTNLTNIVKFKIYDYETPSSDCSHLCYLPTWGNSTWKPLNHLARNWEGRKSKLMNKMWIGKYVKIHEEYFKNSA